jgi:predicted dehydrogenase
MPEKLGIGMIGCGEIAVKTAGAIADSDVVRIVNCTDPVRTVAEDLAAKHEARVSEKLEDLLADDEVQAVVISTPHYLHSPLAIKAMEAGKHCLTEKPLAHTLAGADAMIEAAGKAGVKLCVLFPLRFAFGAQKAREMVAAGAIGKVVAVKLHSMGDKPAHYWHGGYTERVKDDWRVTLDKSGGGYLIMNMIHDIDTMVSITDPRPERIYSEYGTFRTPVEVEDFISFVMRLEGGAIVSLDGSSAAVGGESFGDRIYGEKGSIALSGSGIKVHLLEPWEDVKAGEWVSLEAPPRLPNTRGKVVEEFARAVTSGGEVPISGREGRRSLEIVRGAYLSMKRGSPVEFPVKE